MAIDDVKDSLKRGKDELAMAERLVGISLPVAASRAYIAGENLAYAAAKKMRGSTSRDHAKVWKAVRELYERGDLSRDYRPVLEEAYRLRVKGDYSRDIGGEEVELNRKAVEAHIKELKGFMREVVKILERKPGKSK